MTSTRIDEAANSASDEVTFPFSDLIEDLRNYTYSKFSILSTSELMQARRVSKEFSVGATRALFYKNNHSALFAQSVMLRKKYQFGSFEEVQKQDLLALLLTRPPIDFNQRTILLSLVGKLNGINVNLSVEEYQRFSASIAKRNFVVLFRASVISKQMMQVIASSDLSVVHKCLAYAMRDLGENNYLNYVYALQAFSLACGRLDNVQRLVYLERIRLAGHASVDRKESALHAIALLSATLKDAVQMLDAEQVQSHAIVILSDLEMGFRVDKNIVFLTSYVNKLNAETVAKIVLYLIQEADGANETAREYAILSALKALVNADKMQHSDLISCFDIVIRFTQRDNGEPGKWSVCHAAVLSLAKAIAQKTNKITLSYTLARYYFLETSICFVFAICPFLSNREVNDYVPLMKRCLENEERVAVIFSILLVILEKMEPVELDAIIEKVLPYFKKDKYAQIVDNWFLSCEDRLSSVHHKKCREALMLAIESELVKKTHRLELYSRISRVASMFSSEEAKAYLSILLTAWEQPPNSESFRDAIHAIAAQMNDDDLYGEMANICKFFSTDSDDAAVSTNFFSYLIMRGVCSLETLNSMLLPRKFDSDYLLFLEKIADCSAALPVTSVRVPTFSI